MIFTFSPPHALDWCFLGPVFSLTARELDLLKTTLLIRPEVQSSTENEINKVVFMSTGL